MSNTRRNLFFINEKENNYLKVLDGLRGMAIVLVLLTHTSNWDLLFSKYINFRLAGREVICLFFILSAYLVSRQFSFGLINGKFNLNFCKKYLARRFLRIYPLFALCLLLFAVITYYFGNMGMYGYPFSQVIPHLLFIKGEGMFWAVAVEFKYYFALPLLLIFCHNFVKLRPLPTLFILIALNILNVLLFTFVKLPAFPFAETFPVFSVGCYLAVLEANKKFDNISKTAAFSFETAAWISVIVLIILLPVNYYVIFGHEHSLKNRQTYFIMAVLWGSVVVAALLGKGFFKWLFERKVFRFLGNISYSLYLFHLPVLFFLFHPHIGIPFELKIYAFFAGSIALASMIYLLIERPLAILKLKYFSQTPTKYE